MTEQLPFEEDQSRECFITATNILVIDCPETSFVYNADKFVETGNRGVVNYGDDT